MALVPDEAPWTPEASDASVRSLDGDDSNSSYWEEEDAPTALHPRPPTPRQELIADVSWLGDNGRSLADTNSVWGSPSSEASSRGGGVNSWDYPPTTTVPTSFLPSKGAAATVANEKNPPHTPSEEQLADVRHARATAAQAEAHDAANVRGGSAGGDRESSDRLDAGTEYSRASSMNHYSPYIQAFYDVLSRDMHRLFDTQNLPPLEGDQLDSTMKTFALKLHGESTNPFQWNASVALHRQRRDIVRQFTGQEGAVGSNTEDNDQEPSREPFRKPLSMTMEWLQDVIEGQELPAEDDELMPDEETRPFQLSEYEAFICQSGAYKWLLHKMNQLRHAQRSSGGGPDDWTTIGQALLLRLRQLQPHHQKLSRNTPSPTATVTFDMQWNPFTFFQDQNIVPEKSRTLDKILSLTGTPSECAAMSLQAYLEQTWPVSSVPIITIMDDLFVRLEGTECTYERQGPGTEAVLMTARVMGRKSTVVSVTSGYSFLVEVLEQLAWLGSAMRSPPVLEEERTLRCTPATSIMEVPISSDHDTTSPRRRESVLSCQLYFSWANAMNTPGDDHPDGTCWLPLFWSPFIVPGFPIRARPAPSLGLEIAFDTMAALLSADSVVQLNEMVMIKGFRFLAVAIRETAGVVVWHLLHSGDPTQRISYNEPLLRKLSIQFAATRSSSSLHDLVNKRHMIGWCSEARDMCGRSEAELNVRASSLPKPPAFIQVDRLVIEARSQIIGGLNISINNREKPIRLNRRSDYPSLLKWISPQLVLFYDVDARRAWLVDGASALLHLLRISLHRDANDPESTYDWVFDLGELSDLWDHLPARLSALNVLKNRRNCRLALYPIDGYDDNGKGRGKGKEEAEQYVTLGNRIGDILHTLEILIDGQTGHDDQRAGVKIPQTMAMLRTNMVGFDTSDILQPRGPIYSRVQIVGQHSRGWRDLLSQLSVTTIFGRNFGDLIQPRDPSTVCARWVSVPWNEDLMTVSVATLDMLLSQVRDDGGGEGGEDSDPSAGDIAKGIIWLSSQGSASGCLRCAAAAAIPAAGTNTTTSSVKAASSGSTHGNPLQLLCSKRAWTTFSLSGRRANLAPMDISKLDMRGAVIFGHLSIVDGWKNGRRSHSQGGYGNEEGSEEEGGEEEEKEARKAEAEKQREKGEEVQGDFLQVSKPSSAATRSSLLRRYSLTTSGRETGTTEPSASGSLLTGDMSDIAATGGAKAPAPVSQGKKRLWWLSKVTGKMRKDKG